VEGGERVWGEGVVVRAHTQAEPANRRQMSFVDRNGPMHIYIYIYIYLGVVIGGRTELLTTRTLTCPPRHRPTRGPQPRGSLEALLHSPF